jgi:hypothetical protein
MAYIFTPPTEAGEIEKKAGLFFARTRDKVSNSAPIPSAQGTMKETPSCAHFSF